MSAFKILGRLVSKADQALDTIKREKGTGAEFLRELEKTPGVKQAELKERGIDKALKSKPKMTKAEVRKVLEENPPPKLKEQVRGGNEYQEALDNKAKEIVGDKDATFDDLYGRDREMAREAVESELGFNPETQYEKYRTPGGENYREILLKLPKRGLSEGEQDILMTYESNIRRGDVLDPFHQKQYENLLAKKEAGSQDYFTPHFEGEPNVLAHIRVQDFKTPEGKKVLLVDEIQSDWHQAAYQERQKEIKRIMKETGVDKKTASAQVPDFFGYGPKIDKSVEAYYETKSGQRIPIGFGKTKEEAEASIDVGWKNLVDIKYETIERKIGEGVPEAPFKKNWHELAMKRVLDYAADKGYDTVAITPGKTQAERYDLSKHINTISWSKRGDGLYGIEADTVRGRPIVKKGLTEQELEDTVGKEVANRIINGVGQFANDPLFDSGKLTRGRLENLDLQVGGEGMKGFYDQILPTYLNNLGKQYGAQVGEINLITKPEYTGVNHMRPDEHKIYPAETLKFHSFDITPQMREEIKAKGLPLYGKIALPEAGTLAAGSGAATIGIGAPEQPLPPQMYAQPEYRRGGQVKRKVKFTNNPDTMRLELMSKDR